MKKAIYSSVALGTVLLASIFVFQNCSPEYRFKTLTDANDTLGTGGPEICDPTAPPPTEKHNGLVAELYYFPKDGGQYASSVNSFFTSPEAVNSTARIFFSQINIPTRLFDVGFEMKDGTYLQSSENEKLIEYFALKYFSSLVTTGPADEGVYEFAILSDDGAILELKVDGVWDRIIDNDGLTPTRMGCSLKTVRLRQNEPIELRYYYYQGPRTQIANVLLWRKVGDTAAHSLDAECGKVGNDYFFNSANSAPTDVYQGLMKRGWQVVPSANFILPETVTNPCVDTI